MNDEQLREFYARSTAQRASAAPPCEVPLEAMIDVLERRGTEEERRRTLAAILQHPGCREEFELLHSVVRASRPAPAPVLARVAWRWAAGALLVAGLGLAVLLLRPRRAEPVRGPASPVVLSVPDDQARMVTAPGFAWRAVPGAVEYRFELRTDSGRVILSSLTRDTSLAPPALAPGRYSWQVLAEMPSGQVLASVIRGFVVDTLR